MNLDDIEILIPTFNEEKNLPITINSLKELGLNNLTILDALSDDQTVKVAKENNCKVLIDPTRRLGFGYSVINGLKIQNLNIYVYLMLMVHLTQTLFLK